MSDIKFNIDSISKGDNHVTIEGWAFSTNSKDKVNIKIDGIDHIDYKIILRDDVVNVYSEFDLDRAIGFKVQFNIAKSLKTIKLVFETDGAVKVCKIKIKNIGKKAREQSKFEKIVKLINLRNFKKAFAHIKIYGFKSFISKIIRTIKNPNSAMLYYDVWFREQQPSKEDLDKQREYKFEYSPLISVVVPTYNTPKKFLCEMIDSVLDQTYSNWELCIADGQSQNKDTLKILKEYARKDKRIKVDFLDKNYGISGNTNKCLEMVKGEYIGLFDHDDLLTCDALFEVVKIINSEEKPDFIYSDEDKVDEKNTRFFEPHFKPDFSPDTLRSYNYITHFSVFSKELLEKTGNFNKDCDGSQDYDIILRMTEKANKIIHIPKVLYHWRTHMNSVALNPDSKKYAYEAAKRAISYHLDRVGLEGTVRDGKFIGGYKVDYFIKGNPLISIIIPNKDNKKDLEICINSILNKSSYKNIEIIIVENNSETEEIKDYYKTLEETKNINIINYKGEFNYADINNYGVSFAHGEYIIFLNNDTEVISEDWIEQMLMFCQREDVGIVGAKLYYKDDTVQHGGVVIGLAGSAGHIHHGFIKEEHGYFGRASIVQNLSAVTAACMMIKTQVFKQINGFDDQFKVALNDVDLCLRTRKLGYLIVFNPYVELYHYESKTRGKEDSHEKIERFQREVSLFKDRWKNILDKGDEYYNINLTLSESNFGLKIL